jgi:predicted SAM-dependent methyltransferase
MVTLNIGVGYRDKRGDVRVDIRKTPNVNCIADVRNLPFKDSSFDFIICEHVLEHLQEDPTYNICDQTKALKEIQRVLKRKGKILFKFPNGWQADFFDHKSCWNIRTWQILLKKNGFKVISVLGTGTFVHDGTNKYFNFLLKLLTKHRWFVGFNSEFLVLAERG